MKEDIKTGKGKAVPLTGLERRLLILSAGISLDEDRAAELKELLQEKINWDVVILHSSMHGTAGILYRHIINLAAESHIPKDVLERMRSIYLMITASNMQYLAEYKRVSKELAAEDVEFIVLKGAALIEDLYGDYGFRTMSDVDILVRERDWPRINHILKRLGYSAAEKDFDQIPPKLSKYDVEAHIQYVSESGTCMEFQFDLFTLGIGMRDIEGVWARSRQSEQDDVIVWTLSPEDQLLQLIIHANRHGLMRLKWLVDITESVRRGAGINWDLFIDIARREKVQAVAYHTLNSIAEVFDCRIAPGEVMNQLKPRFFQSVIWRSVWPKKRLDEFNGRNEDVITFYYYRPFCGWNLLNFALMGRMLDKVRYQIRWIAPPLRWMAATYNRPESLELLKYYPKRMLNYGQRKKQKGRF